MTSKSKRKSKNNVLPKKSNDLMNILAKLEKLSSHLDIAIDILLEILLSNPQLSQAVSYTDKASLLESKGMELRDISKIVGRPSNWVSSRLRESKLRKKPRGKRALRETNSPQVKGDNHAKAEKITHGA